MRGMENEMKEDEKGPKMRRTGKMRETRGGLIHAQEGDGAE